MIRIVSTTRALSSLQIWRLLCASAEFGEVALILARHLLLVIGPLVSHASSSQLPWMTGYFNSHFAFSLTIPNDSNPLAFMNFSLAVGAVSWTWNCDPFECVGHGTGDVISGLVGGVILFDGATFNGLVLGDTFEEDKIIDLITWSAVRRYTNLQSGIFRVLDERVVHRRRRLGGNRSQWKANQQPSTDSLLA